MTNYSNDLISASTDQPTGDTPYELIPQLATNPDFISKCERLRELKQLEAAFDKKKDTNGVPKGEYGRLKIEVAAMASAAGVDSVAFMDLRIQNVKGATASQGDVNGRKLLEVLGLVGPENQSLLHSIIAAAIDFDEDALLAAGVRPHLINAARVAGSGRSASVRVEWIGAKGKGAGEKTKATVGDTTVQ